VGGGRGREKEGKRQRKWEKKKGGQKRMERGGHEVGGAVFSSC
jgi:hypothetical protein